jgi:two-component system cell cycle response regulator CpdR
VLVADDDELVAKVMCAALRSRGYDVTHAENGLRAWELLSADLKRFDLLLVDVRMPLLTGVDFIRMARAAQYQGKIVVVSGSVTVAELESIEGCDVERVLRKPFGVRDLIEVVQAVMAA